MTEEPEDKLEIEVPGEWALKKVLGPTLGELGEDLKRLYIKGRDRLIAAANRKIPDSNDGKKANLRVTRDVLWNGSFTDDEVCAEYFGGILASSRSAEGQDDGAIQFVDVVKSLSAKQLHLHYVIYNSLNKLLVAEEGSVNVGMGSEIQRKRAWFASRELVEKLELRLDTDLNILHRQGLLHAYGIDQHEFEGKGSLPYTQVDPNTFGVCFTRRLIIG